MISKNWLRFAVLAAVLILFATQPFYSQTRPRRVQDQTDHPESTLSVETGSRSTNLAHPKPTDQLDVLLANYLSNCSANDNRCNVRRLEIRATALHLINLVDEDRSTTIPSRREFEVKKYATYHVANFSNPARRAPLRRKGRTQH